MIESGGSAITVALMIISLASGTTQAFNCLSCMDSPAAPDPACRINAFDPTSSSFRTQNATTHVSITLLTSSGRFGLTSSDFDCSNACAVYTSASQSITARSCYITANIQAAFPDVQIQYCHTDYCNTSPMFPDTPLPSSGKLQCYFCYNSWQFGSSVVGCSDVNFQPAQIPGQQYGTSLKIGAIIIPPAYFNCSACQVVNIPSIGLTVRACSTTYNLYSLGYSDVQSQTCHSNHCNGYPLITDDKTTQAFNCFSCVDTPTVPNPACRVTTFNPTSSFVGTQNPTTQAAIPLWTSNNFIILNFIDFDCSKACAVYTSAAQSVTVRSCYITANIQAAYPDVQIQYCHGDYCNKSPMLPDTPPPSLPSVLQCYFCYDSDLMQFGFRNSECSDVNFQPTSIPYYRLGTSLQIGAVTIPSAYFDCSACQVVKIPSIRLTVRACSTTYNLASLGYSDVQSQTCHSNRCNGYPLITDKISPRTSGAASSFQLYLYTRIGLFVVAVLCLMFL